MENTTPPRQPRKKRKPPEEIIDYDALCKDFISGAVCLIWQFWR